VSLVRALAEAFYSPSFYRGAARSLSFGRAAGLLALALALGWIVQAVAIQRSMGAWAAEEAERFISELPPLALRGGELEATPPGPHEIVVPDETEPRLVVIDTSGATTSLREEADALVTRTQLIARRNRLETRSFEISALVETFELEDGPISKDRMRAGVAAFARWTPVVIVPFAVLGELAYRLAAALALAVVGLVLARLLDLPLDFGRLFVLSIVVLAPLVLAESVLYAFGQPVSGWVAAPIALAYLAFALVAVRSSPEPA
jgi:hypothetical protein